MKRYKLNHSQESDNDDCDIKVIGENEARISTIDMLRHIELRMETLTQEQEVLNQKKVRFVVILCSERRADE